MKLTKKSSDLFALKNSELTTLISFLNFSGLRSGSFNEFEAISRKFSNSLLIVE